MIVKQLQIFLENKAGSLHRIAAILGEHRINIRAMSLADRSAFGVLRLVVDDTARARNVLKDLGFAVAVNDVLAVKMIDRPGELGRLLKIALDTGLNVETIYGYVQKIDGHAVLIVRFDDLERAIAVLAEGNITVLDTESN